MEIKDVSLFFNDKGEVSSIKATINDEEHFTGDCRTFDCGENQVIGVFSNSTLMEGDEFVIGWYNTVKECVKYGLTKCVVPERTEFEEWRYNMIFYLFTYKTQ